MHTHCVLPSGGTLRGGLPAGLFSLRGCRCALHPSGWGIDPTGYRTLGPGSWGPGVLGPRDPSRELRRLWSGRTRSIDHPGIPRLLVLLTRARARTPRSRGSALEGPSGGSQAQGSACTLNTPIWAYMGTYSGASRAPHPGYPLEEVLEVGGYLPTGNPRIEGYPGTQRSLSTRPGEGP